MYERTVPNIVPPEMAALILDFNQPKIEGYMFRRSCGLFNGVTGRLTNLRIHARIYTPNQCYQASRNHWSWGHKSSGHWVVAYA